MVRKAKKLLRRKGCTKMRVLVQGSFERLMEYYYLSYLKKPAIRVSNTLTQFSSTHPCVHVILPSKWAWESIWFWRREGVSFSWKKVESTFYYRLECSDGMKGCQGTIVGYQMQETEYLATAHTSMKGYVNIMMLYKMNIGSWFIAQQRIYLSTNSNCNEILK